jgi:hypothetical protein
MKSFIKFMLAFMLGAIIGVLLLVGVISILGHLYGGHSRG